MLKNNRGNTKLVQLKTREYCKTAFVVAPRFCSKNTLRYSTKKGNVHKFDVHNRDAIEEK